MSSATAISWLREAMIAAYAVLREHDLQRQWALIAADVVRLLDASAARVYELDPETGLLRRDDAPPVPALAEQMEAELMKLALVAEKSLISTHPQLHFELRSLAGRCQAEGIVTHVLLVRAHGRTHGAIGLHWLGRERPPYEQRAGFYSYWDAIGFAVAAALERSQIELELDVLHPGRARRAADAPLRLSRRLGGMGDAPRGRDLRSGAWPRHRGDAGTQAEAARTLRILQNAYGSFIAIPFQGDNLSALLDEVGVTRPEGSMAAAELTTTETEQERIARWRAEELERAGFEATAASLLATRNDVDLHHAIDLLRNGCSPELALQILL